MVRTELLCVVCFGLLFACGSKPPAAPASEAPSGAVSAMSDAAEPVQAEPPPEARKRKPFDVYNGCAEVVTIVFGEDPKGAAQTLAPSATIEGPRDRAGNQTVWMLDEAGEPLLEVNVTRGMKRVEVGRSCRTLDAR